MDFSERSGSAAGAAAEAWNRTLSQIPTQFGRLVFLARLKDAGGRYNYQTLVDSMGPEITDRTLADSHYHVFSEWIALSLATQKSEIEGYLRGGRGARESDLYRDLVPASAQEVERQLYLSDLQVLLTILRNEPGAFSIPAASQLR